ncbi:hypothetical protein [Paraburkholderia phenoliruptrix]|uniref:hypothetical protein n=1 Tax=Paraburkholderia phenoliruptrix TaxID=252970 RepID=UPI002869AC7C|nr:hypothetical protein [Paraburkholderia phenoliruptrix]WMY10905.1 hypothetical protein P3F88_29935 [Paraburkholderia phenoliruptrix]
MQAIEVFDTNPSLIALGRLEPLSSFEPRPKLSVGLPGDMPVLTCPVAAVDADCFGMKNADVNFGFGTIQLRAGLVQSIRVQVHDVQIYWLADMADPEVWAAIDKWRQAKHAPVQFDVRGEPGEHGHSVFLKAGVPRGSYKNEQFRDMPAPPAESIWKGMVALADSGMLQQQAETDLEGIPLRRVFVNVLLTERFKPCVDESKLVEMPMHVKPVFRKGIIY